MGWVVLFIVSVAWHRSLEGLNESINQVLVIASSSNHSKQGTSLSNYGYVDPISSVGICPTSSTVPKAIGKGESQSLHLNHSLAG